MSAVEVSDLTQVERVLADRRAEDGTAQFRATTLNLVVHADNDDHVGSATEVLGEIGASRPLRAIIALAQDGDEPHAEISSACRADDADSHRMWCSEQIVLRAPRDALASAVTSLLLPDLPVFLWWQGTTATGGRTMRALSDLATRLVVNSDESGLDRLAELDKMRPALTDLAWTRLTPWREAVARLFDAPSQRPALTRLTSVEVRGPSNEAYLIAGWLRSRTGLTVKLKHGRPSGRLQMIELCCGADRFTVRRLRGSDFGRMAAPGVPEKTVLLTEPRSSSLLAAELDVLGRDIVFEQALAAAREDM